MSREKAEPRTCEVSGNDCIAPAGYGISGVGTCAGTKSCRGTCYSCGNPVCRKCSNIRQWKPFNHDCGRQRICHSCYDPEEVKKADKDAKTRTTLTLELQPSGLEHLWQRVQALDPELAKLFRRFKVRKFGAWEIDEQGLFKKD